MWRGRRTFTAEDLTVLLGKYCAKGAGGCAKGAGGCAKGAGGCAKGTGIVRKVPSVVRKAGDCAKAPEIVRKALDIVRKVLEVARKVTEVVRKVLEVVRKALDVVRKVLEAALYMLDVVNGVRRVLWVLGHALHAVLFAARYSEGRGWRPPYARGARVMRSVMELRASQRVSAGGCAPCAGGREGHSACTVGCGDVLCAARP